MANGESRSNGPVIPRGAVAFGILGAALLAIGACISIVAPERLAPPGSVISGAVRIYAGYTFSRDLSLLIVLGVALIQRNRGRFNVCMGIFALMNLIDAIMDIVESRFPVVIIALLLGAGASWAFAATRDRSRAKMAT